jgi:hypothetical protein
MSHQSPIMGAGLRRNAGCRTREELHGTIHWSSVSAV